MAYDAAHVATIIRVAEDFGIPPKLLLACAIAESGLNPISRRPTWKSDDARYWVDVSFGAFQQTTRWMPEYLKWCNDNFWISEQFPGSDVIERVSAPYYDLEFAARHAADNLADKWETYHDLERALAAYNWPAGLGAYYSNAHRDNYRRGLAEADTILANLPKEPPPVVKRALPLIRPTLQVESWDCSIATTTTALKLSGVPVTYEEVRGWMWGAGLVNPAVGLTDASLVRLTDGLYERWGVDAHILRYPTMESLAEHAGISPIILDGHRFGPAGHLITVYGINGDDLLVYNPAPGYMGVDNKLTPAQWDEFAPWTALRIELPLEGEVPDDEDDGMDGYVTPSVMDRFRVLLDEAEDVEGALQGMLAHCVDVALVEPDLEKRRATARLWADQFLGRRPVWDVQ